jgi:rhodanese-related sulfurtransferase
MTQSQPIHQITVEELAVSLASKRESIQLVDVREPEELEIAKLDGFMNLPLSRFAEWGNTIRNYLSEDAETIVMCHHGMRSAQMCQWLMSQGFTNVKNLAGGIDAYSVMIDPSVPRY